MNTIKRDVYVLRDTIKIPIEVTEGTDMVGFEFAVRDYSIPGTAAAVAYVYHKSMDKPKGILCDINDSTISFTPDNNFFAVGMNELQIRVINNGKSLISFKEKIKCSDAMGFPDDEEENQQTLVEQLLTKVGKEEGDRKTADDTEREERIAADDAEKKARIAEENARAEADEAIRANRIVTLDEIDLVTEEGFFVDALAVAELNSKTKWKLFGTVTGIKGINIKELVDSGKDIRAVVTARYSTKGDTIKFVFDISPENVAGAYPDGYCFSPNNYATVAIVVGKSYDLFVQKNWWSMRENASTTIPINDETVKLEVYYR